MSSALRAAKKGGWRASVRWRQSNGLLIPVDQVWKFHALTILSGLFILHHNLDTYYARGSKLGICPVRGDGVMEFESPT
jgi:hypothetical protein